jgi:VanZ family protein
MIKKNLFSILAALIIMYLSMANSHTFDKVPINIPNFDKFVHFGMYFGLMSVLIFENRKTIKSTRNLFLLGLVPLLYGIIIEIMQSTLTTTRTGSIFDAIANLAGILMSILLCLWIRSYKTE